VLIPHCNQNKIRAGNITVLPLIQLMQYSNSQCTAAM
jgi:hypothetical protein